MQSSWIGLYPCLKCERPCLSSLNVQFGEKCLPATQEESPSSQQEPIDSQETVIALDTSEALQADKTGPSQDATSQQASMSMLFNLPGESEAESTSNYPKVKMGGPRSEDDSPSPTHNKCPGRDSTGCGIQKNIGAQLCNDCR